MLRFFAFLLAVWLVVSYGPGAAMAAEQQAQFGLGFKALADLIPNLVGEPIEDEHHGVNGDALQQTTRGLMVWRKADNWTAFTDGSTTWINGPLGLQSRPNDQRLDWEVQGAAPSIAGASPETAGPAGGFGASPLFSPVASAPRAPLFGVNEAFSSDKVAQSGIGWQRIVFSWADVQPGGPDDWRADFYFPPDTLQRQLDRGVQVVGLLQFTPSWAAENSADGQRAVPRNLSAPADSQDNYWARFAGRVAAHYRGRIDRWIIWNEPEFKPGDKGAGQSYTWLGSDADYYLLLKRGYQAIKAANPDATVIFGATSYWVDVTMGRQPFFKRLLALAAADPEARANSFFFDAVAFNLYWCPDDLLRVYVEMKDAMRSRGMDKPIWLTETNAMPYDDPASPRQPNGQRVTMVQQADFAIQTLALGSAAGYERIGWYKATDGGTGGDQEAWGLLRGDGSARPAFDALRTAVGLFSGARKVTFVPLERPDRPFGTPWPMDPNSYYPNWRVYQVVFDHPDGRRVTVLWNATDQPLRVRVQKRGTGATQVDRAGASRPIADAGGWYPVDLPPATVKGPVDPSGYHYIGGAPAMVVESGVPADAPIQEPRLE